MPGIHAKIAVEVVRRFLQDRNVFEQTVGKKELNKTLSEYWDEVAEEIIKQSGYSETTIKKGCPKKTFLSLCEAGVVLGIPPGIYCESDENRKYALTALVVLRTNCNRHYFSEELWQEVLKQLGISQKRHNQQMDVVLVLWNEGFLR